MLLSPLLSLLILGMATLAHAAPEPSLPSTKSTCYRVAVERHATLCKQFARNLNLFCGDPPMQCGVRVHTSMSRIFTQPKWVPLDPVTNEADLPAPRAAWLHPSGDT